MIIGYKCFKKGLVNHYDTQFEVGKTYSIKGPIKFGTSGNGYHLCKNMEDTLRYFDFDEEVEICLVAGFGKEILYEDEYYGYYDMYAVEHMHILKKLSRDEIIAMGLALNILSVTRFIQGFKLTCEEIELFKVKFSEYPNILKAISYYQEHDLEAYSRKLIDKN